MKGKPRKWKWLAVPMLLIGVILAAYNWDAIVLRVAPKVVLSSSLNRVLVQLEERFRGDPLLILAKALDPESKYTADITLVTENDLLGTVKYDMNLQTDGSRHQIQAEGTACAAENVLDLKLYMDDSFMAVASEELVRGNYYGITYNTFSQDIRSIPFLNFLVSDRILTQWERSIRDIQSQMGRDYSLPDIPEVSEEDLQTIFLGILALPGEVQQEAIMVPWREGSFLTCHSIAYQLDGPQIEAVLMDLLGEKAAGSAIEVVFYLHEKSLVQLKLVCSNGTDQTGVRIDFGKDPSQDMLTVRVLDFQDGVYDDYTITVETQNEEDRYRETWTVISGEGETANKNEYHFDWIPSTGEMNLSSGKADPVQMIFTGTEKGFHIYSDNFNDLMQIITKEEKRTPVSCDITVEKGSAVTVPEYRNLDQWSLDDLVILVTGVGSLFGINLGI